MSFLLQILQTCTMSCIYLCAGVVTQFLSICTCPHTCTHITPPLLHMCMQTDVVDDIPTVKFVYIQWVGEGVKTMTRAKISTHKGDLEAVFKVSYSLRAAGVHVYTHMGVSLSRMVSGCGLVAMVMITLL